MTTDSRIIDEVPGLYQVLALTALRETEGVKFDTLPLSAFDHWPLSTVSSTPPARFHPDRLAMSHIRGTTIHIRPTTSSSCTAFDTSNSTPPRTAAWSGSLSRRTAWNTTDNSSPPPRC